MPRRRPQPERTCVGTRASGTSATLLRWFLGPDGTPWPDVSGRAGGRGAWTRPDREAVGAALRRGGFSRAFSTQVRGVNVEELSARVRALGEKGWHNRMGLANRSGALAIGQASAREALRDGRVALVVLADDAGEAAKQKFSRDAERKQLPTVWVREGAALGAALGREFVSVVTVASSPFADDLLRWATWLSSFGAESIVNVWTGASDAAPDSPASPCGAFESPHS